MIEHATNLIHISNPSLVQSSVATLLEEAASVEYTGNQKVLTSVVHSASVTSLRLSTGLSTMQKAGLLMGEQKHAGD